MRLSPTAIPIGRTMPTQAVNVLIHAAAPNYRDDEAVHEFAAFNHALKEYVEDTKPLIVINITTWWLYCDEEAATIPYTIMKRDQMNLFPTATHLVPYSIYGNEPIAGRGFIPHLVAHLNNQTTITGLSDQPRDFIHVQDAAQGIRTAMTAPRGTYMLGTGTPISPRHLANQYGVTAGAWDEHPTAYPKYIHPPVPGWRPRTNLYNHIATMRED